MISSFNHSIALSKELSVVSESTFSRDFLAASTSLLSRLESAFFKSLAIFISVLIFLKASCPLSLSKVSNPARPPLKSWLSFIRARYLVCSFLIEPLLEPKK